MLEPADLPRETIIGALQAGFGIRVAALAFLPVGDDAASWAYRVEAAHGPTYFLKVRASPGNPPGMAVPDYLRRHGVPHILAPLPTDTGALCLRVDQFALALYPMIDGRVGADGGLSQEQWRQLGVVVQRIHAVPLTPELAQLVGREAFRPSRRDLVDLDALTATAARQDPLEEELAAFWRARQGVIRTIVDHADALGRQLERAGLPLVLCHGDLHTWNVLVDSGQQLWVVDWDEAVLAPRERDLMFVVGGIVDGLVRPDDTACFFWGYGDTSVDAQLLAYYRSAWAVQEFGADAERVFLSEGLGEESRRAAVDHFRELFEPGNIVDLASPATR